MLKRFVILLQYENKSCNKVATEYTVQNVVEKTSSVQSIYNNDNNRWPDPAHITITAHIWSTLILVNRVITIFDAEVDFLFTFSSIQSGISYQKTSLNNSDVLQISISYV